jgi:O-antigen/teichoic acid export membrane protein
MNEVAARVLPRWRARVAWDRLRPAGWSIFDQCCVSAMNFVSSWMLARSFPTAQFGAFALAYTGLMLVTGLQNAVIAQPHNVLAASWKDQRYARFTTRLWGAQLLISLAGAALLTLAAALAHYVVRTDRFDIVFLLALVMVPWMAQEYVRRVLYTRAAARDAAINDLLCFGGQLAGVVFLVKSSFAGAHTAKAALIVIGIASLLASIVGLVRLGRRGELDWHWGGIAGVMGAWREAWGFGRWLLAQNVVTWFGVNGNIWVVGALLGTHSVGVYRAVIHPVNTINPLRQAAYAFLPSRAALALQSGGEEGLRRWVRVLFPVLLLPLLPLAVILIGAPHWVLTLFFGERYSGPGLPALLAIAALAQFVAFARFPMDVALLAARATKVLFLISLLPVLLLLVVGVPLISNLGVFGVAISSLVITVSLFVVTAMVYRRWLRTAPQAKGGDS